MGKGSVTVAPWLVAAAAAAAAIVLALPSNGSAPDFRAALGGTPLASAASGSAAFTDTPSGVRIELDVRGLSRAPAGFYYQAWVRGPRGLVAIGTFHTGGRITLWSGVDIRRYPSLSVTLEPEDGDPASSGRKVLTGSIR